MPPEDLPFEELDSGIQNESAFKRGNFYKSRTNLNVNGQNLYQRKRELEKKLEDKRTEIKKGMVSMVQFENIIILNLVVQN